MKAAFFPKTITLVFKDEKAAFIASAGLGMIQLVHLLDHRKQKFNSLLIDHLRENYGCSLTAAEIDGNEKSAQYEYEPASETKTIAGLTCRKMIVKDKTNKTSFEIYYYDKIKFYYWNSPFKDLPYLFLEYTHTMNNLTMKLVATGADLTTPIDTSLFEVRGEYKWVNQKQFLAHLNDL